MSDLFDWLIHIPTYFGEFFKWLTTPIQGLGWTPIAIVGASAGVAISGIIIIHVVKLLNPLS